MNNREKYACRFVTTGQHVFAANGKKRIWTDRNGTDGMTLMLEWTADAVSPAGTLTFSVNGDTGMNNVKDLSEDRRVWTVNGRPVYFDAELAGLPPGGSFILYVS